MALFQAWLTGQRGGMVAVGGGVGRTLLVAQGHIT